MMVTPNSMQCYPTGPKSHSLLDELYRDISARQFTSITLHHIGAYLLLFFLVAIFVYGTRSPEDA